MVRSRVAGFAAATTTIMLWASAFPAIRAALEVFSPGALALARCVAASTVLAAVAVSVGLRVPNRRDLPAITVMGLLGFTTYNLALNEGGKTITAGSASLIVNTVPILTALLAVTFLGERLRARTSVGIGISFLGVTAIALGEGGALGLEPAVVVVLLAALAQASFFTLEKPYLSRYSGRELSTWALWAGTVPLLGFAPTALSELGAAGIGDVAIAVYLGVFPGAIAYATWAFALSLDEASKVTSFLYLVPVFAILIGFLWLDEVPSMLALGGGAVVVSGVALVHARRRQRPVGSAPIWRIRNG